MTETSLYPFPDELLRIPRDASAVIEASAGTGKTYLLEHLVVDRIVRGEARLEEILVVTFTEKATAELVRRLRALLGRLLDHRAAGGDPARSWRLDAAARQRVREARQAFDRASIATIHGFCQRVLLEHPFAGGRLLAQRHVDSQGAFGEAFREALRTELAVDPRLAPYLRVYLGTGRKVDDLEVLLRNARIQRRDWGIPYDERRLTAAVEAFAAIPVDERLKKAVKDHADGTIANAVDKRARTLAEIAQRFLLQRDQATLLREIDAAVDASNDLFSYLDRRLPRRAPPPGPLAAFLEAFHAVADDAVPLALAVGSLFLPVVERRLEARKRSAGFYDFDDMLALVAEALRAPGGPALAASLRQRYRLAIIDEFQDTDAIQWEIFRALFPPGGGRPLYVVADPKQSIYGFRGADLPTYRAARREIAGGEAATLTLARNFRSTRPVVDALNAVFDATALPPFFEDPGLCPEPVVYGGAAGPAPEEGEPVTLLAVRAAPGLEVARLPLRHVRQALTRAIAAEVARLRATSARPAFGEIFVLTRTNPEARHVAEALAEAAIPHALFNQERLYERDEAKHVLYLLAAIDEPRDPTLRLRAWLTPFFGLTLADLPACTVLPGGHPLEERLLSWRALAEARDWPRFFDRILDESGVIRRELLMGGSERGLTNYLHLFELLGAQAASTSASLSDLVRRLGALTEGAIVPAAEEGNVQRLEAGRDAVQIMTMHKAKGLEADYVFVYGAFSPWRGLGVRAYQQDGARVLFAGRPRRKKVEDALAAEADGEDQRLLYVALTRARRRVYLPFAGSAEVEREGSRAEVLWRVAGPYRHVHQRLRALVDQRDPRIAFGTRDVPCPPAADDGAARVAAALAAVEPEHVRVLEQVDEHVDEDKLAALRRKRAGVTITSYTRMKGEQRPATEVLDEVEGDEGAPPADRLPGGAASGIFLHAVLEAVPLETLAGEAGVQAWAGRPEVAALFEAAMRRADRDPRHRPDAERLVHAALTTPVPLGRIVPGAAELPGVAAAARVAREVEFLFPFPAAAGGADRGYVKGFVDVIFEHEGRTYFGDWKSDLLPAYTPETVGAHVAASYELQRRLYALALVKMLGITDRAGYQARFGGTAYFFLRGLPDAIELGRPGWDELAAWERELAEELA